MTCNISDSKPRLLAQFWTKVTLGLALKLYMGVIRCYIRYYMGLALTQTGSAMVVYGYCNALRGPTFDV